MRKSKLTVQKLLVGDDIAEMVDGLATGGFDASKLVVVAVDGKGRVRLGYRNMSTLEAVGALEVVIVLLMQRAQEGDEGYSC